jgi:ABC-type antimicrobial peptide transport system permease subunit
VVGGILLGAPISLFVTRTFSNQLFGVSATDAVTLAGAVLLLLATATIGGLLPARRAARMDAVTVLRNE